jgi:hypothetical protein
MRSSLRLMGVVLVVVFAATAWAACGAPAQSGLALCFPSSGSTVLYPATIEVAVNSGGVALNHLSVYDGNVRVDDLESVPAQLIDYSLQNGVHHLTVEAWDANGRLYKAKTSFTVTGFGVGRCAAGSGAINLCWPATGSYQPESTTPVAAGFGAGVASWSITLDGKLVIDSQQTGRPTGSIETGVYAPAGSHKLVVQAVDAHGNATTVTRQFNTFYNLSCSVSSGACRPGIVFNQPTNMGGDAAVNTGTSFTLQAEVSGNPKPTTTMDVYVDGKKIEQSAGPGITAAVSTTAGSHYVVVQAWDTAGKLYEAYGNVNVQ